MKILFHHRTASRDGQNVHIEELTAALKRAGHDVIIVGPRVVETSDFGGDGGIVALLKRKLPQAVYELMELAYSIPAFFRLDRAYRAHQPDMLYERYNLFFLAGIWLRAWRKVPMLLEVNAPLAHERGKFDGLGLPGLAAWSERSVWRAADRVLPVTDALADHVRAAGVADAKISVIPNGINRYRFPPDPDGAPARAELGIEDRVVLGFTGFMRDWHGLDRVVDILAAEGERLNLHFLVVGDGPARADLERQAEATGVADRMTILGVVDRDRVMHYVAAFDIALQPKVVAYASPLKLFEYMALGRAIIAPDQANIREVLTDRRDALLFDADDDVSFQAAVLELCRDSDLRRTIGAAANALIERKNYTWDGNAERVVCVAGEIATRNPKSLLKAMD